MNLDRHSRFRKNEDRRDRSSRSYRKEHRNFSDSVSSSDLSECSSNESNHRSHRRKRQRQFTSRRIRTRDKKCSRSRSRSCCHCSADEESPVDDKKKKSKLHFQNEEMHKTEDKTKHIAPSNQHTVTAVVHREGDEDNDTKVSKEGEQDAREIEQDTKKEPANEIQKPFEEQKPSESSESGVQEIHYKKLETDTDACSDEKKLETNQGNLDPVANLNENTKTDIEYVQELNTNTHSAEADVEKADILPEITQSDLKSIDDNKKEIKSEEKTMESASLTCVSPKNENIDTIEPKEITNENENVNQEIDVPDSSLSKFAGDTLEGIATSPSPKSELEKSEPEKSDERLSKDKGLVCVILDDDEAIKFKCKKDFNRSKSEHQLRARSPPQKREKNQQKRQRRSRSSFEILSDDTNNDDYSSRLTVHEDSGFEPSPRNSGQAKFEGMYTVISM